MGYTDGKQMTVDIPTYVKFHEDLCLVQSTL